MQLRNYLNGDDTKALWSMDRVFNYGIRFQILTQTQEEADYLTGLQLLYGREVQIDTLNQWKQKARLSQVTAHYRRTAPILKLLPVVFTTWDAGNSLRGM